MPAGNQTMECALRNTIRLLLIGGAIIISFSSAKAQEVTIKLHHFLGTTSTTHAKFLAPWAERIEKESGHRIKVKIFPSMQLGGKPPQLIDQVRDGVVEAVWTLPGYTPGRFPIVSVFELPFMVSTAEATSKALQTFAEKYLDQEFADIHPLLFHVHARGVFHTRKPIRSLNDMKGMTIRAPTRPIGNALAKMGATPIFMPVPQVPEALARGVVDGAMIPWEVGLPLKVHELINYHSEVPGPRGLYTSVFLFAMHKPTYDSLPVELKKVIDNNSGMKLAGMIGHVWDEAEKDGINAAVKKGNTIIEIEKKVVEKMKTVTKPVSEIWLSDMEKRGIDGLNLLRVARELIKRYTDHDQQ